MCYCCYSCGNRDHHFPPERNSILEHTSPCTSKVTFCSHVTDDSCLWKPKVEIAQCYRLVNHNFGFTFAVLTIMSIIKATVGITVKLTKNCPTGKSGILEIILNHCSWMSERFLLCGVCKAIFTFLFLPAKVILEIMFRCWLLGFNEINPSLLTYYHPVKLIWQTGSK